MSLAFQKLNGAGTVAGALLDSYRSPEIYKIARELMPDKNLMPVFKTWVIEPTLTATTRIVFDGVYFGIYSIRTAILDLANTRYSSIMTSLSLAGVTVFRNSLVLSGIVGSVGLTNNKRAVKFVGSADRFSCVGFGTNNTLRYASLSLIGFKIT